MKGVLKAISIMDYGLFGGKDGKEILKKFRVPDEKLRLEINKFLDKEAEFEKDLEPLLKKMAPVKPPAPATPAKPK